MNFPGVVSDRVGFVQRDIETYPGELIEIWALDDDVSRRYKSRDYKEVTSDTVFEEGKEEEEKKSR